MVSHALDDCEGAAVTDRKALCSPAAKKRMPAGRAIQHDVPNNDIFSGNESTTLTRINRNSPARQALADIVIGITGKLQRNAMGQPGSETLPCGPGKAGVDRTIRQSRLTPACNHFVAQQGAHRPVNVTDRQMKTDLISIFECGLTERDQISRIKRLIEPVLLCFLAIHADSLTRSFCRTQQGFQINPVSLPV